VLKAQIFYQLENYQAGIEPIRTALEVAAAKGQELRENWYRLLNVFSGDDARGAAFRARV
jgi:hypothetical protein